MKKEDKSPTLFLLFLMEGIFQCDLDLDQFYKASYLVRIVKYFQTNQLKVIYTLLTSMM